MQLHSLTAADQRWIAVWFVLALIIRGGVIGSLAGMLEKDNDGYAQLAENLRNEGVYGFRDGDAVRPTAFRPPLYPALLALTVRNGRITRPWVAMAHAALGAATVAIVWILMRRLFPSSAAAHAAAIFTALDPILLIQSPQLMTETLATFLAAAGFWMLVEAFFQNRYRCWLIAGLVLGAACLCRPTFIVTTAAVSLALLLPAGRIQRVGGVFVMIVVAATPVTLWTARNVTVFGQPIVATTHGGYTMLLGNNPDFYAYLRDPNPRDVWRAAELDRRLDKLRVENGWDELEYDQYCREQALMTMRSSGWTDAALHRLSRLIGVLPQRTDPAESDQRRYARFAVAGWYVLEYLFIAVAVFTWLYVVNQVMLRRFDRDPLEWPYAYIVVLLSLAFLISFAALHTVYWCDMRMRAPLAPVLAIAAGFGFGILGRCFSRRPEQAIAESSVIR